MHLLSPPHGRIAFAAFWGASLLSCSLVSSVQADIVYSNTGPATGGQVVAPYPASPTNVYTWIGAGYPGVQIAPFIMPQAGTLNSVTLFMGNAPVTGGGFSVSLRTIDTNGSGSLSLTLVEDLIGTDNPATAGSYNYTGSASISAGTYIILAQVLSGGGQYLWEKGLDSNPGAFDEAIVIRNGPVGPDIGGTLDLNDVVIFLISPGGASNEFMMTVDVTFTPPAVAAVGTGTSTGSGGTTATPVILLTDIGAISSALFSSVPIALSQRELAFNSSQTTLHDFNGRLFRLRAGAGGEEDRTEEGEGDGTEYHTVTIGEGDGIEPARGGKGTKVVMGTRNPDAHRWEVFTSFDYGGLDMDADKSFLGLQSDTYAETVGIERTLTEHLLLGAGVSYLESFSDQSTDVDGVTMAAYVSGTWGGLYADVLYGATILDHDIDRATGLGSTAHASPGSVVHAVNFNTGYNFYSGNWSTGPFAGLDYAHAKIDGYTEAGGGTAATDVSDQSVDSLITRLGWQASYRMKTSWGAITPQVRAGWERENQNSDDPVKVGLVNSPFYLVKGNTIASAGGSFGVTVPGQDREKDYMTAGAGVRLDIGQRLNVSLDYDGYFFDEGSAAHFGRLMLGWKF